MSENIEDNPAYRIVKYLKDLNNLIIEIPKTLALMDKQINDLQYPNKYLVAYLECGCSSFKVEFKDTHNLDFYKTQRFKCEECLRYLKVVSEDDEY